MLLSEFNFKKKRFIIDELIKNILKKFSTNKCNIKKYLKKIKTSYPK